MSIERPEDDDPTGDMPGFNHPQYDQIDSRAGQGNELAGEMRAKDIPQNLGTTSGPRGDDLVRLRSALETLNAMLVGPKEEYDWTQARRHLRLLISRWEMDSGDSGTAEAMATAE